MAARKYTFYWLSGQCEVLEGNDPADCMNKAGYGGGATRALDFYAEGDDHEYEWKEVDGKNQWTKKDIKVVLVGPGPIDIMGPIHDAIEEYNKINLKHVWGCNAGKAVLHNGSVITASHCGESGSFDIEVMSISEFMKELKELKEVEE